MGPLTTRGAREVIHELDCVTPFFEDVHQGLKTFEVRLNDRSFAVGDYLLLRELVVADEAVEVTGRTCAATVTYIFEDGQFGLLTGDVVVLGISVGVQRVIGDSTEKAIQAAAEALERIAGRDDSGFRTFGSVHEPAKTAIDAALASGELHAANGCPNQERADRCGLVVEDWNYERQRVEKAEKRVAELETQLKEQTPEGYQQMSMALDRARAELVQKDKSIDALLAELEQHQAAVVELVDLQAKVARGELVERKRLQKKAHNFCDCRGSFHLPDHETFSVYRLLDPGPGELGVPGFDAGLEVGGTTHIKQSDKEPEEQK